MLPEQWIRQQPRTHLRVHLQTCPWATPFVTRLSSGLALSAAAIGATTFRLVPNLRCARFHSSLHKDRVELIAQHGPPVLSFQEKGTDVAVFHQDIKRLVQGLDGGEEPSLQKMGAIPGRKDSPALAPDKVENLSGLLCLPLSQGALPGLQRVLEEDVSNLRSLRHLLCGYNAFVVPAKEPYDMEVGGKLSHSNVSNSQKQSLQEWGLALMDFRDRVLVGKPHLFCLFGKSEAYALLRRIVLSLVSILGLIFGFSQSVCHTVHEESSDPKALFKLGEMQGMHPKGLHRDAWFALTCRFKPLSDGIHNVEESAGLGIGL